MDHYRVLRELLGVETASYRFVKIPPGETIDATVPAGYGDLQIAWHGKTLTVSRSELNQATVKLDGTNLEPDS